MDVLSDRNPRVVSALKLVKASERRKTGRFLAEGANAVEGALGSGLAVEIFVTAEVELRRPGILEAAAEAGIPVWVVSERVAKALSETVTPQGIVAVCHQPRHTLDEVLASASAQAFIAVLVNVNDPGNAGAVVRVADAAGAHAVLLLGDAVDPCNGKAIRSTAGSFFHLPVIRERDVQLALEVLRAHGFHLVGTTGHADATLLDISRRDGIGRVAWLLGNEAHGLPAEILGAADELVRIPIFGRAESLNLATAAALCLYESARMVHESP